MAYTLVPWGPQQFFLDDGTVAAGAQLFVYEAGTTTKTTTYQDSAGSSANTNPIVLDSAGRATIYINNSLTAPDIKLVLASSTDTDPPASPIWTRDNIAPIADAGDNLDIQGTAGENLATGEVIYLSDGSGSTTAGRWYLADADNTYSSSAANALGVALATITTGNSGSIRLSGRVTGLTGLTAGTLYYISATAGALTSTAPANDRAVGTADTTTSLVLGQWVVPGTWSTYPSASATVTGIVDLAAQTLGDGLKHFKQQPTFDPGDSNPTSATARTVGVITGSIDFTSAGNVGAGEDTLRTYSLPANVLDANNRGIRIHVFVDLAANANSKTTKVYFGGTGGTLVCAAASTANDYNLHIVVDLFRTGVGAQIAFGTMWAGTTYGALSGECRRTTPAQDETGTIDITVTGESAASASDDVTYKGMYVEVIS